jgi:hypothetical protein
VNKHRRDGKFSATKLHNVNICTDFSSVFFQIIEKPGSNFIDSYLSPTMFSIVCRAMKLSKTITDIPAHWKEREKASWEKDEISLTKLSPLSHDRSFFPWSFLRMKICRAFGVCVSEKDNKYRKVFLFLFFPFLLHRSSSTHRNNTICLLISGDFACTGFFPFLVEKFIIKNS